MRPGCNFFPRINFENAIKSIPDGSLVIFSFGEIDCREGILTAVAQNKYQDLEQGIRKSVSIYVKKLEELAITRHFRIFVHPIVPVLDPTRSTVRKFTASLKLAVDESKRLVYLDFFDDLLADNGESFNRNFALDGTHMSPLYIPLLQSAMENVYLPSS